MTEKQTLPWKRLSAEAAAIVGGILLAFWIEAWWSEREELESLVANLVALEQEIEQNQAALQATIDQVHTNFEKLDYIFNVLADTSTDPLPDGLMVDIGEIYGIFAPAVTISAYDVVVSPDNLRLIENSDLRIQIVQSRAYLRSVDTMFDIVWSEFSERQAPYLVNNFVMSDFNWDYGGDQLQEIGLFHPVPDSPHSVDAADVRSREFWNLLYNWRAAYFDATRTVLEAMEYEAETLELLREEIDRLQR